MKCLSLNQPFADLVVSGKKSIELRKWKTKYRGVLLIHASKKILTDECKRLGLDPKSFVTGAIVGKANIYDVKEYEWGSDEWMNDKDKHFADTNFLQSVNGFLLKDAFKFSNPVPYKGQLQIFDVPDEVVYNVS